MQTALCSFMLLLGAQAWVVDPARSSVVFTVTKFGTEIVEGRFHRFNGAVVYDTEEPSRSSLEWRVRVSSVKTGEPERDQALQGPAFFDAARFPELSFVADRIRPLPDGRIVVSGVITIRGMRKPLVVTARAAGANVFETRFQLNRHDFGVSGGSVTRHAISDHVNVQLRLAGAPR